MDPYWRKVFERSEQYLKGAVILQRYMYYTDKEDWHKSGLLSWQAPTLHRSIHLSIMHTT